jgi:hypothetical protein
MMNTQQQNYHRSDLHPLPMRVSRLQIERLRELRAKDGLSVQEHVRRSIDQYLETLTDAPPRPKLPPPPTDPVPTGEALVAALRSAPLKHRPKRLRVRQR